MHRPEGWDASEVYRKVTGTYDYMIEWDTKMIEAGADAYEKALEPINPDVIFQWYKFNDCITPQPLTYMGKKGKLVFIPEEEA